MHNPMYDHQQALSWFLTHCWFCKRDGIYLIEIDSRILDMTICICQDCARKVSISDPKLRQMS